MKKTYLNPEASIVAIDLEDIITTSGTGVLFLNTTGDNGYNEQDSDSWNNMFGA